MAGPLVLAIDQGTSSTKCLLVDASGAVVGRGQAPVLLATPEPGWVQQDADEIWASARRANVSLDTLDPARFKAITRRGDLARVLAGVNAGQRAGLAVKINAVALKRGQRGRIRTDGALGARPRHGHHLHRGHAARRY
jgi:hypothetical protein